MMHSFFNRVAWQTGSLLLSLLYSTITLIYRHPRYTFACFILLVIIGWFCDEEGPPNETRDALHALQTIIVPTSGNWPSGYDSSLVSVRTMRRPRPTENNRIGNLDIGRGTAMRTIKIIRVPLLKLIEDILAGHLEIRTPGDMDDFLLNRLRVYGWQIRLDVESSCLTRLVSWMIKSQWSSSKPEDFLKRCDSLFTVRHHPQYTVELDVASYSQLGEILQALQVALATGAQAAIFFSTVVPDLDFLGTKYAICAVPFFLRRQTMPGPILTDTRLNPLGPEERISLFDTSGRPRFFLNRTDLPTFLESRVTPGPADTVFLSSRNRQMAASPILTLGDDTQTATGPTFPLSGDTQTGTGPIFSLGEDSQTVTGPNILGEGTQTTASPVLSPRADAQTVTRSLTTDHEDYTRLFRTNRLQTSPTARPKLTYTSTPLLVSLTKVMELLATHAPGLHVETVTDVSKLRMKNLIDEEQRITRDGVPRSAYLRKHDVCTWREERLLLAWEAGLLGNGNLQKWKIKVSKR